MKTNRAALVGAALVGATAYVVIGTYRIDLDVYRIGARALLDGRNLYGPIPATRDGLALPFTYPPAAAILFVPLTLVPFAVASAGITLMSLASLGAALALTRRRLGTAAGPSPPLLLLLLGALLLEPVRSTLGYGQINLILMALVCADLFPRSTPWPRGLLIGLAAAIKLTPAGFLLALLVLRQRRAAATAVVTFLAVTGAAWLIAPEDSLQYWTATVWDPGRIGGATYAGNQSLKATALRAHLAPELSQVVYVVAALVCLILAALAMRRAARHDRHALVVGLNALLILLVSPVSWTHHWVWLAVVPLCLWHEGPTRPSFRLLAAVGLALILTSPMKWLPREHDQELQWLPWQQILGNSYVLYGAVVIVAALTIRATASPQRAARQTENGMRLVAQPPALQVADVPGPGHLVDVGHATAGQGAT
jgi:alpha-1,2-mannosyltransferase